MIGIIIGALTAACIIGMSISNYRYTQRLKNLYSYKMSHGYRITITVNPYYFAAKLTGITGTKHYVSGKKIGSIDNWFPASDAVLLVARAEIVEGDK